MYNIRCDLDLGVGNTTIKRIQYTRNFCIEQLELPWNKNEKRFQSKEMRCEEELYVLE